MISTTTAQKAAGVPRATAKYYADALGLPRGRAGVAGTLSLAQAAGLVIASALVRRRGLSVRAAVALAGVAIGEMPRLLADDAAQAIVVAAEDRSRPGGIAYVVEEDRAAALDLARLAGGALLLALDVRAALVDALDAIRAAEPATEEAAR